MNCVDIFIETRQLSIFLLEETMETARINAPLLPQYATKHIRVLGKVTEINQGENTAVLDCQGPLNIIVESSIDFSVGDWIDVVGIVQQDFQVRALQCYNTNQSDINADAVGKMVDLWHKYPQLFYNK